MAMTTLPVTKPIARLTKVGSHSFIGTPSAGNYHSFPIPVRSRGKTCVAFLYATAEVDAATQALRLHVPAYVSLVDVLTARFDELREFAPSEIGLAQPSDGWLGECRPYDDWKKPEVLAALAALYRGYDALLPAFTAASDNLTSELRRAAGEFATAFGSLAEPCLIPYYRGVGREFFAWLDRAVHPYGVPAPEPAS
jgi:hypothetical protein